MEDWEQFFADKSRRRADKERRLSRRRRLEGLIAGAVIVAFLVAGILGLAFIRR